MKRFIMGAAALTLTGLALTACGGGESAPKVESQQTGTSYAGNPSAPVDKNVYLVTGEVAGQVNSLTRQTKPATGSVDTPTCYGTSGCFGGGGGTFMGPVEAGKGFVRVLIQDVTPNTDLATPGQLDILKVVDTKATALQAGDVVTFKCIRQFEAVTASVKNQKFDQDVDGTWELDYCRMATNEVHVKPAG